MRSDWRDVPVLVAGALLALSIVFAAAVGILMLGSDAVAGSDGAESLLGSAAVILLYAIPIFLATLILRFGQFSYGMVAAIVLAFAATLLWLTLLWGNAYWEDEDRYAMAATALTLLVVGLLHAGAFTCLRTRSTGLYVAKLLTCGGFSFGIAGYALLLLWYAAFGDSGTAPPIVFIPFLWMGSFAFLIAIVGSVPLVFLIRRSNRRWEEARESVSRSISLHLSCPECGSKQELRAGHAKCSGCAALMHIELEEPRCECGYLLFKLQSPTCPECGCEVDEKHRWRDERQESIAESKGQTEADVKSDSTPSQPVADSPSGPTSSV